MRPMTKEEKMKNEIVEKRERVLIRIALIVVIVAIAAGVFSPDRNAVSRIERKMESMREDRHDDRKVVRMLYLEDGGAEVREGNRVIEKYEIAGYRKYRIKDEK